MSQSIVYRQKGLIMSELNTKEVDFRVYCPKCQHYPLKETEEPCNECLEQGFNYGSKKPINYKEREHGSKV